MLPMLAMTAISGGLSLMSGIGGRNAAKKQQRLQKMENDRVEATNIAETDRVNMHNWDVGQELLRTPVERTSRSGVDVDRMMLDADRAGFNPVTWLNAGAMQAYGWNYDTETQPAEAFRMMLRTPNLISAGTVAKIPDAMEIVGDAGQAALNTFRSEYAREDSQAFQSEQLTRQLSAIQAAKRTPGFGSIPRMGGAGDKSVLGLPVLQGASTEKPKVTVDLFGPDNWWRTNTRMPDASSVQNVYGEGADIPYTIFRTLDDWQMNLTRGLGIGKNGVSMYDIPAGVRYINRLGTETAASLDKWYAGVDPRWKSWDPRQGAAWVRDFYGNPNRDQPWLGSGM